MLDDPNVSPEMVAMLSSFRTDPMTDVERVGVYVIVTLVVLVVFWLNTRTLNDWEACSRPRSMGRGHQFVMRRGPLFHRTYREMTEEEKDEFVGLMAL